MKKVLYSILLLFILAVALVGCNSKSTKQESGESVNKNSNDAREIILADSVNVHAYLSSSKLNSYGEAVVLLVVDNDSKEKISFDIQDYHLQSTKNKELTLGPYLGEGYAYSTKIGLEPKVGGLYNTVFNLQMGRDTSITSIDPKDYQLVYIGKETGMPKKIPLSLKVPKEYRKYIDDFASNREGNSSESTGNSSGSTVADNSDNSQAPNAIKMTGYQLEKGGKSVQLHVRVENLTNQKQYYDSTKLKIYDGKYEYGIDPKVKDSAFDSDMTIPPNGKIDYNDYFLLINNTDQSKSEIMKNIKGLHYTDNTSTIHTIDVYGNYESQLPDDFSVE